MNFILLFVLEAVWMSSFSLGKMTVQVSSPAFLTSARMILAGVVLLTFLVLFKRKDLKVSSKQWIPLIFLAIFSVYLTNICEFWSLQYLTSTKTCFLYSLSPIFAALLSFIHFKEKMSLKKWLGLLIGLCAFIPVLLEQSPAEKSQGITSFLTWPALAMVGAAFFSVYGWILLRILVKSKENSLSPITANGYSMLLGGVFALIHSSFTDNWSPIPVHASQGATFLEGLLIITLVSNIFCFNLYGYLLKKFTATFLSFAGLLSPFFASIYGWILLGEKPSLTIYASTAIVSIGLWFVYQAELKQGYIQKTTAQKDET